MNRNKLILICYLAIWSAAISWVSFELYLSHLSPLRTRHNSLAELAPGIPLLALPTAALVAYLLLRRTTLHPWICIKLYAFGAPLILYLVLLLWVTAVSAMAAPVLAPLVLLLGFLFGLPGLAMGMAFHALGVLPLWFVQDRFWRPT